MRPLSLFCGLLSGIIAIVLTGCDKHHDLEWAGIYNFPGNSWAANEKLVFTPDSAEFSFPYKGELCLLIRYCDGIEKDTLQLGVTVENRNDSKTFTADTVEIPLFASKESKKLLTKKILNMHEVETRVTLQDTIKQGDRICVYQTESAGTLSDIYTLGIIISR